MALIAYLLFIIKIILIIGEPVDDGTDVGKVIVHNGRKVVLNPSLFPYMVHLEFRRYTTENGKRYINFSNCGGVLIERNIVLTAAHCVGAHNQNKPEATAWLGILDTELDKRKGQKIAVRGYTVHFAYVRPKPGLDFRNANDIALLWLEHPANLEGKYVKTASLPPHDFVADRKLGWIIGWGRQSCGPQKTMLQKALVRAISQVECQKYYKFIKIVTNVICAKSDDNKKSSTQGDSGGPFMIDDTVVGILAYVPLDHSNKNKETGKTGCDAKKPAAFTYVPRYVFWIRSSIKKGPETILIENSQLKAKL